MRLKCNVLHGILYRQVHENGIKKKNSRVIKASRNRVVSVKGVVKEKKSRVVRYQSGKEQSEMKRMFDRPSFASQIMQIADVGHNKRGGLVYRKTAIQYHSIEAPKTISAAAALAMRGDKLAPKRGAPPVLLLVAAGVEATLLTDGVVSPSALDAFPRSELEKEHTERMLFTSEGRLVVFRTPVWFVFSKLYPCRKYAKGSKDYPAKRTNRHIVGKRTGRCPRRST